MYDTVDESYLLDVLHDIVPKVIIFEIFQYTYSKCIDCNKYLLKEFKCGCGAIRYHYHAFLYVYSVNCISCYELGIHYKNDEMDTYIKCIVSNCVLDAFFGYKDCILFCTKHTRYKHNILEYDFCCEYKCPFITNMIEQNTTRSCCIKHRKPNVKYIYNYVTIIK